MLRSGRVDAVLRSRRVAGALLGLSIAAHFALQLVPRTTTMIDLRVYRHAPPGLFDGSLYDFRLGEFSEQFPLPFTYPPFAALVFLPLSWAPWDVVRIGWHALSIAALWWIARCALRLVRPDAPATWALLWTALALWFEPVRTTFNYGQVNLLIVAVLLGAVVASRDVLAGLGVGLTAGVKLVPAITGLYFLATRRWAAAAWSAAWFAVTVGLAAAVAPVASQQYWLHLLGDATRIGPVGSAINQSLRGALSRTIGHDVGFGAAWVVAVVAATALAVAAIRAAARAHDRLAVLVAIQLYGLLVSPISWSHHYVWVVPTLVWLVHGPLRERTLVRASALLWALLVGSYLVPLLVVAQPTTWTIPRPWFLWLPGWAYALAAVLTLVAVAVTRPRDRGPAQSGVPTEPGAAAAGPPASAQDRVDLPGQRDVLAGEAAVGVCREP